MGESDRCIAAALRIIREAPGTVYSRDLYEVLGVDGGVGIAADKEVLDRLNSWFEMPMVMADGTSSRSIPGMVELVTVIEFRMFLDLLLAHVTGRETEGVQIHPDDVLEASRIGDVEVRVRVRHPDLVVPGQPGSEAYRPWLEEVQERYQEATESRLHTLSYVDQARLGQRLNSVGGVTVLDLRNCYVEDIDLAAALRSLDLHGQPVRLAASESIFAGTSIEMGAVQYCAFDLSWGVFTAENVSLAGATFDISLAEDNDASTTIQFRDSTFCPGVRRLSFDDAVITGTTHALSFEDAQVRGVRITFNGSDLGRAILDFYQTRLLDGSAVEFVETKMHDATLRFVDVTLTGPSDAPGVVVFYRVSPMPPSDFLFRTADEVRIENCSLGPYARFANIAKLSLWQSSVSSTLLSVIPREGVTGDFGQDKFWLLDALEADRPNERRALAAEFAAIKEVFHAMGEYDLEDEAFVRHMRFKTETRLGRVAYRILDRVGLFGTSPKRIVISFLGVFAVFALLNWFLMGTWPSQFNAAPEHPFLDGATAAAAQLIQAGGPITPATSSMALVFIVESLVGWFFLGYLFSGFVRKTLR